MIDSGSDTPVISVIVCAYNEEALLPLCLDSLSIQSLAEGTFEVVIVDDGSTDQTRKIAAQWVRDPSTPRARYVRVRHAGLSAARNAGIDNSRGELVAFIDGDAVAHREWLSSIVTAFERNPSVVAVSGPVDNHPLGPSRSGFFHAAHYAPNLATAAVPITGTNMAFRRVCFAKVPGFRPQFERRGDESAFVRELELAYGPPVVHYCGSARVSNEHPGALGSWLRLQFFEGRMTRQIDRLFSESGWGPLAATKVGLRATHLFGAVSLAILPARRLRQRRRGGIGPILVAAAIMVRYLRRVRFLMYGVRMTSERRGIGSALAVVPLGAAGLLARDAGYVLESLAPAPTPGQEGKGPTAGEVLEVL